MNMIKFNLPINTKLVGIKAILGNELYFKTEVLPKLLELGFTTDFPVQPKPQSLEFEDIYWKENFNEYDKNEIEKLFYESDYIDSYIETHEHVSKTNYNRIAYVLTKMNDTIKHFVISNS